MKQDKSQSSSLSRRDEQFHDEKAVFQSPFVTVQSRGCASVKMDRISFSSCPGSSYEIPSFLLRAGRCCKSGGPKIQILLVVSGGKGCVESCPGSPSGGSGLVCQRPGLGLL